MLREQYVKDIPGFVLTSTLQAVFRRYLRPEKDYLSFSLIYKKGERSLDLVRKHSDSRIGNKFVNFKQILNLLLPLFIFLDLQGQS